MELIGYITLAVCAVCLCGALCYGIISEVKTSQIKAKNTHYYIEVTKDVDSDC